jgi:hypothetical protein
MPGMPPAKEEARVLVAVVFLLYCCGLPSWLPIRTV